MFLAILLVKNVLHSIIRKNFASKSFLMIELTLLTLLNYVGDNFCEYRNLGHDNYKSLLLSYSDASNKFCLLYTSPSPRDKRQARMPSSA